MPEVWFHYLEGVAGCANYLNIYTSSSRSHTMHQVPHQQDNLLVYVNVTKVLLTSLVLVTMMVHQSKC